MTTRDPRQDPQPGDQLRLGRFLLTVTEAGAHVLYELCDPGGRGLNAIPLACRMSLREWQKRAKAWEVA